MKKAVFFAIFAAALYALNAPLSKLLLQNVPPTMMAGLLYLGAGIGMSFMGLIRQRTSFAGKECRLLSGKSLLFKENRGNMLAGKEAQSFENGNKD